MPRICLAAFTAALFALGPGAEAQDQPEAPAEPAAPSKCAEQLYLSDNLDMTWPKSLFERGGCEPDPRRYSVLITSGGGDIIAATAAFELMRNTAKNGGSVTTVAVGTVGSAAVLVFLGGSERIVSCYSTLFLHPVARGINEKRVTLAEIDEYAELGAAADAGYARIVSDRTGLSVERVRDMMRDTTILSAAEALELGFATRPETGGCAPDNSLRPPEATR